MSRLILAWEPEEKREETIDRLGHKARVYEDRPVRDSHWKKVRSHTIPELDHYKIKEEPNSN